ncbi:tetratricopeptide repeat protein [Paludibaculum fermentans]|uniref:Tetratricopeptide repeat protein n=1 Tax=Paludibaculum fermentans TaxID=1473598 RepID=A0A7S7NK44_PALFE|nr:hypothetical protein [Paludibaculum fermentans]QOY85111.1 hypothetical protein IRI77_19950 [Paludibaculum fermentans]
MSYTALDPANPYKWAAYAESLDSSGDTGGASKAFDRALALGPAIAPVHMRAFNFHLIHEHSGQVLALGHRILELTTAYNDLIFADFIGTPTLDILRIGIPPQSVPAYLAWAQGARPTRELLEIWRWMRERGLTGASSASSLTTTLCRRGEYAAAARLWADWLPAQRRAGYLEGNFLSNPRFAEPFKTPLDWSLDSAGGLESLQKEGLIVAFPGTDNLAYRNVRQLSYVIPGRYIFSAVIEGVGITTNEGPFFHVFDADHPDRFGVATEQVRGTSARRTVEVRFVIPPETRAVVTQLERNVSDRLDNKIAGTLKVYEVSLRKDN